MPSAAMSPASGDGVGNCGGPNADQRAKNNNVVLLMSSPSIATDDGGTFGFSIYAFPTEADAAKMVTDTLVQSGCGFREFTQPEGSGVGQYDGFGDSFGEGRVTWTLREDTSAGNPDIAGVDGAVFVRLDTEYLTSYRGDSYGSKDSQITVYEQHGRFVFRSSIYGACCAYGFSNSATAESYTPTLEKLLGGMEVLRPVVLQRLEEAKLI